MSQLVMSQLKTQTSSQLCFWMVSKGWGCKVDGYLLIITLNLIISFCLTWAPTRAHARLQRKIASVKFNIFPESHIWMAAVLLLHVIKVNRLTMENMKAILTLWIWWWKRWTGRKGRKINKDLKHSFSSHLSEILQVVVPCLLLATGASVDSVDQTHAHQMTHLWMRGSS